MFFADGGILFSLGSLSSNFNIQTGCLIISLIWEEPRSELSIMPMGPRFGTSLGASTPCPTDLVLETTIKHLPPRIGWCSDGSRCCGDRHAACSRLPLFFTSTSGDRMGQLSDGRTVNACDLITFSAYYTTPRVVGGKRPLGLG